MQSLSSCLKSTFFESNKVWFSRLLYLLYDTVAEVSFGQNYAFMSYADDILYCYYSAVCGRVTTKTALREVYRTGFISCGN
jgi:hypothetical protein